MNLIVRNRPTTFKLADKAPGVKETAMFNTITSSTQQSPSQCDNMHISIFSQHNYIYFLLCVLQHYMFRPSVWAIIRCVWRLSHTIAWRRGEEGLLGGGGRSRYVGLLIM